VLRDVHGSIEGVYLLEMGMVMGGSCELEQAMPRWTRPGGESSTGMQLGAVLPDFVAHYICGDELENEHMFISSSFGHVV